MSKSSELGPVGSVLTMFVVFGGVGALLTFVGASPFKRTPVSFPKAHQIPMIPGGTSLRLAMVHDVLLQRFPKHGPAWQESIAERARARLEALESGAEAGTKPELEALRDFDDLGAALDRLKRSDEAIRVLERKLALLREHYDEPEETLPEATSDKELSIADSMFGSRSPPDYHDPGFLRYEAMVRAAPELSELEQAWYRTFANLGTFIIHANFPAALRGEPAGKAGLLRGAELIDRAIALNPGAHFGRERWQAGAVRFILAAIEQPDRLLTTSLVGLPLDPREDVPVELSVPVRLPQRAKLIPSPSLPSSSTPTGKGGPLIAPQARRHQRHCRAERQRNPKT